MPSFDITVTIRMHIRYEWTTLEFDWPSDEVRFNYTKEGWYIPENCALAGVKMYKGEVSVALVWRGPVHVASFACVLARLLVNSTL
jgi:hypothetical protein